MRPLKAEVIFPELANAERIDPVVDESVEAAEATAVPEPALIELDEAEIELETATDTPLHVHVQVDGEEIIVVPSRDTEPVADEADSSDELCRRRIELLEQVAEVVESVVDPGTALPAVQKLHEVAARLQPVREQLRELPDPSGAARAELAERSARLIRRLNAKATTIRSHPDLQQAVLGTMRA